MPDPVVLQVVGLVLGGGILSGVGKIMFDMGWVKKGMNGLVKVSDDHENRIRDIEHKEAD